MSLAACIPGLIENGQITKEQGDQALEIFGRLRAQHGKTMGAAAADALASSQTADAMARKAVQDKRQMLLQVKAQRDAMVSIASYDGGKGLDNPGDAAKALFDHDGKAPYANVAILQKAIIGRAHAMMEGILNRFDRDLLGRMRNGAEMRDVVRELFGTATGSDAAKQFADAWTQTSEMLRQRFNAAGGAIGKLERWGLPQSHDPVKVRSAGFEAWRGFIVPLLDRGRMIDRLTGQPLSAEALDDALRDVFDTISTDGWIKRTPGGQKGVSKLGNQRQEHRFLTFADADGWMHYHEQFGAGATPFEAMIGHVDGMARDIAHMEILGPNPSATVGWLQDVVRKQAALKGEDASFGGSAEGQAKAIGKLYDLTSGALSMPVNPKWAHTLQGARALLTAAKLGAAVISATTDIGFQAVTRAFNGLPVLGAISGYVKLLNPANEADRRIAVRLGLIAEEAGKLAGGINRYMGESIGPGIAARLADGVLRLSGLSAWTQAGKWAFGMELLGHLSDIGNVRFEGLHPAERAMMKRYGIGAEAWDAIRQADRLEHKGAVFVDPMKIADQKLADQLLQMVLTETSYAVPEVTARARALTTWDRPGTFAGEVGRSMLQFKGFGVSMLMTHGRRAMEQQGWNRAKYAGGLFITTTLLGALALQLKEIIKGKDPQPMDDDPRFWAKAALQGGGAGIFGDFLQTSFQQQLSKSSGSQRVGSIAETLAGPLVGALSDGVSLGLSPFDDHPQQKMSREAARILKSYTPGSSLWYTRLAFQRLVVDQLQEMTDPHYQQSFHMMKAAARSQDQDFWWDPGAFAPDRAPELANAGGAE